MKRLVGTRGMGATERRAKIEGLRKSLGHRLEVRKDSLAIYTGNYSPWKIWVNGIGVEVNATECLIFLRGMDASLNMIVSRLGGRK